jgi:hypothetical protein
MRTNDETLLRRFRRLLTESIKYDVDANLQMLLNGLQGEEGIEEVRQAIQRMGSAGTLCISENWSEPFCRLYENSGIANCEANEQTLVDALIREGRGLDYESLQFVASLDSVRPKLAMTAEYDAQQRAERAAEAQAEKDERDSIEMRATLLEWFETAKKPLYASNKYAWQSVLKNETKRLTGMTADQLRAEFADRTEKRRIKQLDPKAYRAEVAATRQQPTGYQFETLPDVYRARSGQEIPMTRKGLIELSNRDPFSFREVVRRFGADAVNQILAGTV